MMIVVDWGTSRLRAWQLDDGGEVCAAAQCDAGMARLGPDEFEGALRTLIATLPATEAPTVVIACGMVGARQGWVEAPYQPVPGTIDASRAVVAPTSDSDLRVHILAGLSQRKPHVDVMRGEETQIAGYRLVHPSGPDPSTRTATETPREVLEEAIEETTGETLEEATGETTRETLCLPGTHAKWVSLRGPRVEHFTTFMTGECFELLATRSVLRHSVTADHRPGDSAGDDPFDSAAFETAVGDACREPGVVSARLFGLRATSLLDRADPVAARSALSGYLIGLELAGSHEYWTGRAPVIIASENLASRYASALEVVQPGVGVRREDATEMTVAGLRAAANALGATEMPGSVRDD